MSTDTAIVTGIRALWEQGHLRDLTIQVEDCNFKVHKLIMASVSDYFHAMLTGGMAESREDTVPLRVVTASAMENLISFIYKNHMSLTGENVAEILDGAVYLQMHSAIAACIQFMVDNLDTKICYKVLSVFQNYSLSDGVSKVRSYIKTNIENIATECDAHIIPYDECCFLVDHWRDSEMDLFFFVRKWVEADYKNRKQHINDLMVHVRFCLITAEELGVIRRTELYQGGEGGWLSMVDAAVGYHEKPVNQRVLHDSEQNTVRSAPALTVFLAGYTTPRCYILSEEKRWKRKRNFSVSGSCYGATKTVEVNNFLIYATSHLYDNNLMIFDPRTLSWSELTEICVWKVDYAVVYHNGNLYILGGCVGSVVSDSIEQYNLQTNTWRSFLKLPDKRYDFAACAHNDHIYISGGCNSHGNDLSEFDCLNLDSGQWESKAPMLIAESEHLMSVMKLHSEEVVCVVFRDLRVDYYNAHSDQWSRFTFACNHNLPGDTQNGKVIKKANTIYYIDDHNSIGGAWYNDGACFELTFPEEGSEVIVNKIKHCSKPPLANENVFSPCGGLLSLPSYK